MNKQWLIAIVVGMSFAGCDRSEQAATTTQPATQPAVAVAVLPTQASPPATRPTFRPRVAVVTTATAPTGSSFFVGDGTTDRIYDFPPAKLRLIKEGDKYSAVLYSDDPKTAINRDFDGNTYFLQMKIELEDRHKLSEADWRYEAASSEHEESLDGIFLQGQRYQLQPSHVAAKFKTVEGNMVQMVVWGQFLKFDNQEPNKPGVPVGVRGEMTAILEVK